MRLFSYKEKIKTLEEQLTNNREQFQEMLQFIKSMNDNKHFSFRSIQSQELIEALNGFKDKNEEVRSKGDRINWDMKGLEQLSEIIEDYDGDMEQTTYKIIACLCHYVRANQSAFFIVNETIPDDRYFEASAIYAYSRRKYLKTKIDMGNGMMSECFHSGETIYMTDVPSDYIKITSGLGEATPRCIALLPLKFEEKVLGIIEFAFFEPLPAYMLQFLEKAATRIGGFLTRIMETQHMRSLLEDYKLKTEQLLEKEETQKQTMKEMLLLQEEMGRQNEMLVEAQNDLQLKHNEIEEIKHREMELLESKLQAQDAIHQTVVKRLVKKISQLQEVTLQSN